MQTLEPGTEVITPTGLRADIVESVGGQDYIALTRETPRRRVAVNGKECHVPSMPWWPGEKPAPPQVEEKRETLVIRPPANETVSGAPTGNPPRPGMITKPMQPSTPENPPKPPANPPKSEDNNTATPHSIDPPSDPTIPVVEGEQFVPPTSDSESEDSTDPLNDQRPISNEG